MIYRMKLLTLVVSLFVLTKSATGQENLIEIYQRALQNDPVIREAEANYLVMLEAKPQARSRIQAQRWRCSSSCSRLLNRSLKLAGELVPPKLCKAMRTWCMPDKVSW